MKKGNKNPVRCPAGQASILFRIEKPIRAHFGKQCYEG